MYFTSIIVDEAFLHPFYETSFVGFSDSYRLRINFTDEMAGLCKEQEGNLILLRILMRLYSFIQEVKAPSFSPSVTIEKLK